MKLAPPPPPQRRRLSRVSRVGSGGNSESSVDDDLSYLDLDTGRVQIMQRTREDVFLSHAEFDEVFQKLNMIESKFEKLDKLDKLDSMEQCLRSTSVQVSDLEARVSKSESKTQALEQSSEFISSQYDDIIQQRALDEKHMSKQKQSLDQIAQQNKSLKASQQEICDINSQIKHELTDTKCWSMRDNLLFNNIPETTQPNQYGRPHEDTVKVLSNFFKKNSSLLELFIT